MEYGKPWCRDGISVRDLQLRSPPNDGLDAWGREKEQPVLLSVHLSFKSGFDSAADNDTLDESTMHYGVLSKNLRGISSTGSWGDLGNLAGRVLAVIRATPPGIDIMEHVTIEIKLPKASLLGEAVIFVMHWHYTGRGVVFDRMLHIKNICIPTLIGVNSNEREARQKLIVNVWFGNPGNGQCNSYVDLEQALTKVRQEVDVWRCLMPDVIKQIIDPTDFETLESLAVHILKELYQSYEPLKQDKTTIRLRLEKPQAVPWADAPAIEVFRTSEQLRKLVAS